jgi:hypothetical protein
VGGAGTDADHTGQQKQQVAVLRQIARHGGVIVTLGESSKPCCTLADNGAALGRSFDLNKFVTSRWLIVAPGCAPLFNQGWAQKYVARRP